MLLATSNQAKRLLVLRYLGHVRRGDVDRSADDIQTLMGELGPGFRLLVDCTQLDSMDIACAQEVGRFMERAEQGGVTQVVRVMPDPSKDIGMKILAAFHYRKLPPVVTCQNLAEAAAALGL